MSDAPIASNWKQLADGMERREAYLRGVQQNQERQRARHSRPTEPTSGSGSFRVAAIVLLAIVIVAGLWFLS